MQEVVHSGATAFDNFLPLFTRFVQPLGIQFGDLRSAVVKEAARTATLAASTCGESFAVPAERLTDALFRLLNSGTKVISETGHQCLIELITLVPTWRWIPKILEQISSKNPNIRVKAAFYLENILENYPLSVIEGAKNNLCESIEAAIKVTVHDAAEHARASGRKAFKAYKALFPERGKRLFTLLDLYAQKAIGDMPDSPLRSSSQVTGKRYKPQTPQPSAVQKSKAKAQELNSSAGTFYSTDRMAVALDSFSGHESLHSSLPKERARGSDLFSKVEFTLEKVLNENWSTRFNAMEKLGGLLREHDLLGTHLLDTALWKRVINCLIDSMIDPHYRVQITAFSNLKDLIEKLPEQMSQHLEKILPRLVNCLGDSKDLVVSETSTVFEHILDIYMADDLLSLLLRYPVEEIKAKAKLRLLELFCELAESSTSYLESPINVRNFIRMTNNIVAETSQPALTKLLRKIIEICMKKNPQAASAVLEQLPAPDKMPPTNTRSYESPAWELPTKQIGHTPVEEYKREPQESARDNDTLTRILAQCRDTGLAKLNGLRELGQLAQENSHAVANSLEEALELCSLGLTDEVSQIRNMAVSVLKSIVIAQATTITQQLNYYLPFIVKLLYNEDRQTLQSIEESIETLLSGQNPTSLVPILIKLLETEELPAIQTLIRLLTMNVKKFTREILRGFMRMIMDCMKELFNHNSADVRKTVVFCLVEAHGILGNDVKSYFDELSPSQQKLVTIYIQRRLLDN